VHDRKTLAIFTQTPSFKKTRNLLLNEQLPRSDAR
jgi:hypothetical protein